MVVRCPSRSERARGYISTAAVYNSARRYVSDRWRSSSTCVDTESGGMNIATSDRAPDQTLTT
jgi:hypothetical protein